MRHGAVISIVAVLVLAGCISASGKDPTPEGGNADPIQPGDVDPNSALGMVQGTVVDEENVPLASSQVALSELAKTTQTDVLGVFAFRDVAPGRYSLLVGALGYESTARTIDVRAGELTSVAIVLRAVEVADELYVEIIHHVGFFECALATDVWISSCSYPYTNAVGTTKNGTCLGSTCTPAPGVDLTQYGAPKDIQNNVHRFNISVRPNIGQLQIELVWDSASAAATRMLIMVLCGDYDFFWDECYEGIRYGPGSGVSGPSPVKSIVAGEEFIEKGKGSIKYDLEKFPEVWIMNYIGLPFGDPQVAFQQKFEVWDSVFYNGEGPEDWSVLQDG